MGEHPAIDGRAIHDRAHRRAPPPIGVTVNQPSLAARFVPASLALALVPALLAGCLPEPSPPDGVVAPGAESPTGRLALAVEAEFLWPADTRATDAGIVFSEASELPLRVRIRNTGRQAVAVHLDDLAMRPVPATDEPVSEGFVEALYAAPGALRLERGQYRDLDFGEVSLFFGFACTVHLTGELRAVDGSADSVAISHDSRPILLEF